MSTFSVDMMIIVQKPGDFASKIFIWRFGDLKLKSWRYGDSGTPLIPPYFFTKYKFCLLSANFVKYFIYTFSVLKITDFRKTTFDINTFTYRLVRPRPPK